MRNVLASGQLSADKGLPCDRNIALKQNALAHDVNIKTPALGQKFFDRTAHGADGIFDDLQVVSHMLNYKTTSVGINFIR